MFEKFGEFDSLEELNAAAAGFLAEGDEASIFALAQENGLDREDAQDYIDGIIPVLAALTEAAIGKISMMRQHLVVKNKNVAERMACSVMLSMLQTMCSDPEIAAAVMKKGKRVTEIYAAMGKEALKHVSGSGQERQAVSCGTDQELRDILWIYYMKPEELNQKLAALYVFRGE